MTTVHEKQRNKTANVSKSINVAAAERFREITTDLIGSISNGETPISIDSFGKTDNLFLLDMLQHVIKELAINAPTPEKKIQARRLYSKALFHAKLKEHGGVYSSAKVAEIINRSKVTVKNNKDNNKLLALDLDGEFYYPVFQFVEDESKTSSHRILKGIDKLLPLLDRFSDRMKYSFFMKKRNTVLNGVYPKGREFTVAQLLQENPNEVVMEELMRLARLEGTQDLA
jgi:hypothetical protein